MVDIIRHDQNVDWGLTFDYMESNGKAYARAYVFHDDDTTIYLSCLSVYDKLRKKGVGTKLQEVRENLGRSLGCEYSCLWVKKGSWMRKWYARRGYGYFKCRPDDKTTVWLRKKL